jgi:hypothetical protein
MDVCLRPGEIYGLHGHRVDWLRSQIHVIDEMTRLGLRQHPKSKKSHRVVPVPAQILERMSVLMAAQGKVRESWARRSDAPVTHDAKEGRSSCRETASDLGRGGRI